MYSPVSYNHLRGSTMHPIYACVMLNLLTCSSLLPDLDGQTCVQPGTPSPWLSGDIY